jgi:hypothetical protein
VPLLFSDAAKQRFFQLSADLTTLRWAWNKYVLLFYVEAVHSCDEELSLRLVLTMEADLVLGFTVGGAAAGERCWGAARLRGLGWMPGMLAGLPAWLPVGWAATRADAYPAPPAPQDKATYEQWKAGFKLLLNMLMAPGPYASAAAAGPGGAQGAGGALHAQRSLVMHAMGMNGYSERRRCAALPQHACHACRACPPAWPSCTPSNLALPLMLPPAPCPSHSLCQRQPGGHRPEAGWQPAAQHSGPAGTAATGGAGLGGAIAGCGGAAAGPFAARRPAQQRLGRVGCGSRAGAALQVSRRGIVPLGSCLAVNATGHSL